MFGFFKKKSNNIIDQFQNHMEKGEYQKALPLIEDIIRLNDSIDTSWYNYGNCLEKLNRHKEAADCFKKGYELNPNDKGVSYRILRSLALAGDVKEFTKTAIIEIEKDQAVYNLLIEYEEFEKMVNDKWFKFKTKRFA